MTLLEADLRRFKVWIFIPALARYRFEYPVLHETTNTQRLRPGGQIGNSTATFSA